MISEPSLQLQLARRTLDHVPGVLLLGDWKWEMASERWSLHCRLSLQAPGNGIPAESDWYVLVSPSYPWGSIKIYPAQVDGLQGTYWHQSYNEHGNGSVSWRSGDLCLNTTVRILGRLGMDMEPFEAENRLQWHLERAISWLEAASRGTLVLPGEPFELPQLPHRHPGNLAFSESPESLGVWTEDHARCGFVDILPLQRRETIFITRRFRALDDRLVHEVAWGDLVNDSPIPPRTGFWIRLKALPIVPPWQAPRTWGELREACRRQGTNLDDLLQRLAPHAREGESVLLCVGFPIPSLVGSCPVQIHWVALWLPTLTKKGAAIRGFRPSESAYWFNDRSTALQDSEPLRWIDSENWHMDEIASRGRLPKAVTDRDVLLIGLGALGAPIARLLVRSGVRSLVILDEDILTIGNLVRHPLDTDHISFPKSDSLASELRKISPHVKVRSIQAAFPKLTPDERARVLQCDLIIDCTAEDSVIPALAEFGWDNPEATIISLSLGMGARHLFCYTALATAFKEEDFRKALSPWLTAQREENKDVDLPREGVGCWHPVFPARMDDVMLFAATAIKEIERVVSTDIALPALTVFEQVLDSDDESFIGIRRAERAPGAS